MSDTRTKSRLGRGLSGLMGGTSVTHAPVDPVFAETPAPTHMPVVPHGTPADLPIDSVRPNPHQPRKTFDPIALAELAESIKSNGLIQPIVVRRVGDTYELIAGERRLRASKLAGMPTVAAFVRDAETSAQAQMALVENIQRADLNPLERAAGYQSLLTELGLSQAELAIRLGEDRSVITNHLRLLDLDEQVQTFVRDAKLTMGHAKVLAGISPPAEQVRLALLVVSQGLTVRNLERAIATASTPPTAPTPPAGGSAHLRDLELRMSKTLGMRVQIRASAGKGRGKLVLHYNSLDEFDGVLEKLGVTGDE